MARKEMNNCCVVMSAVILASVLNGCQSTFRYATPEQGTAASDQKADAVYSLRRFIDLGKEIEEAYDSEPMQANGLVERMVWVEADITRATGYSFKWHYELWAYWRRWLEDRDVKVIHEILDDPGLAEAVTADPESGRAAITLAVDIAFDGGRTEDTDYVKSKYKSLMETHKNDKSFLREAGSAFGDALADWSVRHGPAGSVCGGAPCERAVALTGKTYKRLAQVMDRNKKELDEIETALVEQHGQEYARRAMAARFADLVVVGVVDSATTSKTDSFSVADCAVRMSVSRVLKGSEPLKQINFNAHLQFGRGENEPEEGQSYIAFLYVRPNKSYCFIKMTKATEQNIAIVNKEIDEVLAPRPAAMPSSAPASAAGPMSAQRLTVSCFPSPFTSTSTLKSTRSVSL
jgi:hypothetical protein